MLLAALLALSSLPQGPGNAAPQTLSTNTRPLPHLGTSVRDERSLDRRTGQIIRTVTDAAGNRVDGDALVRAEAVARDRATGKISHELAPRLATQERVRVVFWLKRKPAHPDLRGVLSDATSRGLEPEDARRAALEVARTETTALTAPFVAALRQAGHQTVYVDPFVPIVFVDLASRDVAALAARPEVDQAYFSFPQWFSEIEGASPSIALVPNDWASPSARTDAVHRKGITGAGVKVMVNDTAPMNSANPNLPPLVRGGPNGSASHATAVAGIISSSHAQYTGAAPGLTQIYDWGGSGDVNAPMAWSWGMTQGVSFGNCSWWNGNRGSIVFLDRYFDYIIRNFGVMMFKSCGNQGNNNPCTTPCNGFNMIGTGCAVDGDTHDWDDDVMASFSSTGNPQPSNHEKPEITNPGSAIWSTTTSSPWVGSVGSGTSYASPVTCGTAALLAETKAVLKAQPEAIKALLMAGAWHNIHGAAWLSDWDGAGGSDAAASQAAAARDGFRTATLTPASFTGGVYSETISLVAGDETRIVGLWFSNANAAATSDVLEMDLDMVVEDPNGNVVVGAASSTNPFEIVLFVPPLTGDYTVKMVRQRFDGTSEPFALAWSTRRDAATDVVTVQGSAMIGQSLNLEFFDPYHPGATYAGIASVTGSPATLPISFNKILEFGFDPLSALSLTGAFPGFVGTLPANGRAQGSIPIPNDASFRNIEVFVGMITLDFSLPGLVEETSATASFTIQ